MQEDADFLLDVIRRYGLDVVSPGDLQCVIARPWLSLGRIPASPMIWCALFPPTDRHVAQLSTLLITNSCTQRADRVALLMLVAAELPGFVRNTPPSALSSVTALKLARTLGASRLVEILTTQRLYAALLRLELGVLAALLLSGDRMSKGEVYRKRAQDSLKLADKFTLIEIQGCLLSMAYAWWRLAEFAPGLLEGADDGKLATRD